MSRELGPDELDLTSSDDVVGAMSAAVGRLRELAAAAFNAGRAERKAAGSDSGPSVGATTAG